MKWIGLTGGIASGKSTVSMILRDLGLPVVDADHFAREVVKLNSPGLKAIEKEFGKEVIVSSGDLDRRKLGQMIFESPEKREKLESILHPRIQELRAIERRRLEDEGCEMAFYDVPLLFEKNLDDEFDATVLVYAKPSEQRIRLSERDHLSAEQVDARLRAQMPIDEKVKRSSFVIFNEGSLSDLKLNVQRVLAELSKL